MKDNHRDHYSVDGNHVPAKIGDVILVEVSGIKKPQWKWPVMLVWKYSSGRMLKSGQRVVVVGYGTQKKVSLTGAVAAVTGEKYPNVR